VLVGIFSPSVSGKTHQPNEVYLPALCAKMVRVIGTSMPRGLPRCTPRPAR
jgi:hypothetical protein